MKKTFTIPALTVAALLMIAPQAGALTSSQQRMKDCNAEAGSKKGPERQAFMKTCLSDKAQAQHETQQEKMKTCNADASAKSLKGAERRKFMSTCLSSH